MADDTCTVEAYAYRVSARFGGRVLVSISDGSVTIVGPRVGLAVYRLWILGQALLLALALAGLVLAPVLWQWTMLLVAAGALLAHLAVGGFGAASLWEIANLTAFGEGARGETVSFPLSAIRDVRIGAGWARRGMWLLLLPWLAGINAMAAGVAVSFVAPDGTADGGVFALHLRSPEEAQSLANRLLGAGHEAGRLGR